MRIELNSGKYTYIFNEQTGESKALRYGEEWQDLTGDSLVLSMAQEIERLREDKEDLLAELEDIGESYYDYGIELDMAE